MLAAAACAAVVEPEESSDTFGATAEACEPTTPTLPTVKKKSKDLTNSQLKYNTIITICYTYLTGDLKPKLLYRRLSQSHNACLTRHWPGCDVRHQIIMILIGVENLLTALTCKFFI